MPGRAAKPCSYPGCRVLVRDGGSKCEKHRTQWVKRNDEGRTVKGRALQAARSRLFRANPLCVECERAWRVALAVVRDHTTPIAEGGLDVDSNTQGLCHDCHDAKSLAERIRGVHRSN